MVSSNSSPHPKPEAHPSVGMCRIKEKARLVGRATKVFALSSQVLGFLSLLRDVGDHARTEYLISWVAQDQWIQFFEPWLKNCLEHLIIHPTCSSSDMEVARETAIQTIPQFLINIVYNRSMPSLLSDSAHRVVPDLRVLKQIRDPLKELILISWEKVAEDKPTIQTWGAWSHLVLLVKPEIAEPNSTGCTQARAFVALGTDSHSKFASGLEQLAREIPRMSSTDLTNVRDIFLILAGRAFAASSQGYDVIQGSIPPLVRLIRKLLHGHKSFKEPYDIELALEIVKAVTSCLTSYIQGVGCEGVRAVVDAGILKTFLVAHPSFTSSTLFQSLWANLLDNITQFLVYPDVLRRFLQARRRLVKCGLDDDTDTVTKPCTPWDWAKVKAFGVHQVRHTMKAEGTLHICANHTKCFTGDSPITFKRCSRCKKVSYCSRACQKSHWNAIHRDECPKLRDGLYLTLDSRRFLRCFAASALTLHMSTLTQRMVTYASTMDPTVNEDHERIRMRTANPFLFINLDLPRLPTEEDFEVLNARGFVDLMAKILESQSLPFLQDLVAEWRETTIEDVLVLARFPLTRELTQEDTDASFVGFIWRLDGHIIFL
ncbi:hypothetical protein E1B28_006907 [Marasmius oreades]|uniref:phytol kinase n=1 Tax=Marasmius oreades TaxID=181124 RepID=A0A9P7S0K9_9AGAR|nr:uncharacterized protein E1B28_006907 [Marasmius oreades]KAG7093221.1 hypothetical protein E1B28_006907 [Marasmius oreades]